MKKRSMLAVASLAVGFAASLAAPSAHAATSLGDGKTPNLLGNSTVLDPLLGGHHSAPETAMTSSTTGGLLGG
ncbi:hypothetical protein ACFZB9_13305 [Kitasatospora sp. NPDC008050]|uniref:hypothetical protein n=1 Tax=Kitasatospora sp. NPDC008050 TaxID=3364021 RepID=UPI0036EDC199